MVCIYWIIVFWLVPMEYKLTCNTFKTNCCPLFASSQVITLYSCGLGLKALLGATTTSFLVIAAWISPIDLTLNYLCIYYIYILKLLKVDILNCTFDCIRCLATSSIPISVSKNIFPVLPLTSKSKTSLVTRRPTIEGQFDL